MARLIPEVVIPAVVVENCLRCPKRKTEVDTGFQEAYDYCEAKYYGLSLEWEGINEVKPFPDWCPLKEIE